MRSETANYAVVSGLKIFIALFYGMPAVKRLHNIYMFGPRYLIAFRRDAWFVDSTRSDVGGAGGMGVGKGEDIGGPIVGGPIVGGYGTAGVQQQGGGGPMILK